MLMQIFRRSFAGTRYVDVRERLAQKIAQSDVSAGSPLPVFLELAGQIQATWLAETATEPYRSVLTALGIILLP
ncbi:unnamed protein product [Amoebophrya sp. A25]|nr:unnamed protein product [Amoebophrya sp. A25]|eukprot:GSA25T00008526001.1